MSKQELGRWTGQRGGELRRKGSMDFIGKKGPGVTEGVPLFTEYTRATSMAHSLERHRRYEGLK